LVDQPVANPAASRKAEHGRAYATGAYTRQHIRRRNVSRSRWRSRRTKSCISLGASPALERVAGAGPQVYHCYPGTMEMRRDRVCELGCGYQALTATCSDLPGNLDPRLER
jgi:hypothetical protein